MGPEIKASIEFSNNLMRYAETSNKIAGHSVLKRLGTCEFDFNLVRALSGSTGLGQVRAISDSLEDVFASSSADTLSIVLNPQICDSFVTMAPGSVTGDQLRDQIHYESELLRSDSGIDWGEIRFEPIRSQTIGDQELVWYHVIRVSSHVVARLESLLIHLPIPEYTLTTTYRSVGALIENSIVHRQPEDSSSGYIVALGCYASHLEFTVVDRDEWFYGHSNADFGINNPSYYTASLLKMLDLPPKEIGNIYLYGDEAIAQDASNFEKVFRYTPSKIDPFAAFAPTAQKSSVEFDSEEYAACLGASLRSAA